MNLVLYLLAMCLLVSLGYFVFRVQVRNNYERKGELSQIATVLEFLIFATHANISYAFLPTKWPFLPALPKNLLQSTIGICFIVVGLLITLMAMNSLGFQKAFGHNQSALFRSGFYRYTRNPQILSYGLLLLGCVILWPSLYALGWLIVYGVIAHMMVITEEEHLKRLFGTEYERFCQEVPRYILK